MYAAPPVVISTTVQTQLSIPGAGGAGGVTGVKLSNASALFVTVTVGASTLYLDPQTFVTIPLGGISGTIALALSPGQSSGAAAVYPTFFYSTDPAVVFGVGSINQQTVSIGGTVDIGTINAGNVIEVLNTPGGSLSGSSTDQVVANETVSVPAANTPTLFSFSTQTTPESHSVEIEVAGEIFTSSWSGSSFAYYRVKVYAGTSIYGEELYDTGELGLVINSSGGFFQVVTGLVIPVSSISPQITLAITSATLGGPNSANFQIAINGYTQASPPSAAIASLLNQGLINFNVKNSDGSNWYPTPMLSSRLLNLSVGQSLSPADFSAQSVVTGTSGTIYTTTQPVILRSVSYYNGASGSYTLVVGNNDSDIDVSTGSGKFNISPTGFYIPANTTLQVTQPNGTVGYFYQLTTL